MMQPSVRGSTFARLGAILSVTFYFSCIDIFKDGVGGTSDDQQTGVLTGQIIDEDSLPVAGVTARLAVLPKEAVTGPDGIFLITVPEFKSGSGLAKTGSVVIDTLILSFGEQRFYIKTLTQSSHNIGTMIMAKKEIMGEITALDAVGVVTLGAVFNPLGTAVKLNANINLLFDQVTGRFYGKLYYHYTTNSQTYIVDISGYGENNLVVFSNYLLSFRHATIPTQMGNLIYPENPDRCVGCEADSDSSTKKDIPPNLMFTISGKVVDSRIKMPIEGVQFYWEYRGTGLDPISDRPENPRFFDGSVGNSDTAGNFKLAIMDDREVRALVPPCESPGNEKCAIKGGDGFLHARKNGCKDTELFLAGNSVLGRTLHAQQSIEMDCDYSYCDSSQSAEKCNSKDVCSIPGQCTKEGTVISNHLEICLNRKNENAGTIPMYFSFEDPNKPEAVFYHADSSGCARAFNVPPSFEVISVVNCSNEYKTDTLLIQMGTFPDMTVDLKNDCRSDSDSRIKITQNYEK